MPQSVLERPSTKEAGKKASPFCRWALSNPLTRCTQPKKEWNTENRIEFLLHNRTVLLLWPAWRSLPIPLPLSIAGIRTLAWNPWLGAASSVLMMTHISYLDQPPSLHLHPHWHLSWSSGQAVLAKDTLCAQWALVKINWSTCLGAAALLFTFTSTFAFTFTAAYLTHTNTCTHETITPTRGRVDSHYLVPYDLIYNIHVRALPYTTCFGICILHIDDSCSVALLQVLATGVLERFPASAHLPDIQLSFNQPRGGACWFITRYSVH